MSWKDTLRECFKLKTLWEEDINGDEFDEEEFNSISYADPLSDSDIEDIEALIKSKFPAEYRSMLKTFEHVYDDYIWSVDDIISGNLDLRRIQKRDGLYESFDDLIFFGGAGNGDQFAVAAKDSDLKPGIYIWSHENDSRNLISTSLKDALLKIYRTDNDSMLECC